MKLKEIRDSKGITQQCLSERVGVTQSALSQMENGAIKGSIDVLKRIADVLNVTVDEIIGG